MLDCKSFIEEYKNAKNYNKQTSDKQCLDMVKKTINSTQAGEVPPFMDILKATNINDGLFDARLAIFNLARKQRLSDATEKVFQLNADIVEQVINDTTASVDINYDTFKKIRESLIEHSQEYEAILSPSVFALLPSACPQDGSTPLGIPAKRKYIYKQDLIDQIKHTIYSMQWYLEMKQTYAENDRFIMDEGIYAFIQNHYKQFSQPFNEMYEQFYLCYCTRAIMFLLNAKGRTVSIEKLISSQYLEAAMFFDGRPTSLYQKIFGPLQELGVDHIFCRQAFMKAVEFYVSATSLTPETRGLLNKQSIRGMNFYPTEHFVECMFYITPLHDGCIDFGPFIDYILTITFPFAPQAGYYAFKVLDSINDAGYLNRFMIEQAIDSVYKDLIKMYGSIQIPKADFVDEIFDNAKPADGLNIYYKDIVRNNANDIFVRYLVCSQSLAEREMLANAGQQIINDVPWKG